LTDFTIYHTGADQPSTDLSQAHLALWIDLKNPVRQSELALEALLSLDIPTREDMDERINSSRFYSENGRAYMTVQLAHYGGEPDLQSGPVTFVLSKSQLITIRYISTETLDQVGKVGCSHPEQWQTPSQVFLLILEAIIDRCSDLITTNTAQIEALSKAIFRKSGRLGLEDQLNKLGRCQNEMAIIRDSLGSLSRLCSFASQIDPSFIGLKDKPLDEFRHSIKSGLIDIQDLGDHVNYVTGHITFLLNAALGLISLEQNNIVRMISIISAIFLPLTLIASLYGMNFANMPGLNSPFGFWFIIISMVGLVLSLMAYFRFRRWL
jgi:magnesium transporter